MPRRVPQHPVNLELDGRPVLVVGAGRVAARKTLDLLEAGALVTVVAPQVGEELAALADEGRVSLRTRGFEPDDLDGCWFVVTATDDAATNAAVRAEGDRRHIFVNSADDPVNCSATLPARVRRGELLVTVSTGGRAPAVSSWLRAWLEEALGDEHARLVELVGEIRDELHAADRTTEGLDWQRALGSGTLELIREGRLAEAKERLEACLSSSSD